MTRNRRRSERLPVGFYVDQIIGDDPHRCFTTDLSAIGLYMERLVEPLRRTLNVVQLEIPLPATSDSIWAKGEVDLRPLRRAVPRHGRALHRDGALPPEAVARLVAETTRIAIASALHPFRPQIRVHRPTPPS